MEMNTSYVDLVLGVESPRDRFTQSYREGVAYLNEASGTIDSLRKFLNSIDKVAGTNQVKDGRLSKSRGDMKSLDAYKSIQEAIDFINEYKLTGVTCFKELTQIHDALAKNVNSYKAGYERNISIIELEYENAAYLLITGLSMILAAEVEFTGFGSKFGVKRKKSKTGGVIYDTIRKMAKELSSKSHSGYLQALIEASVKESLKPSPVKESAIYEATLPAASDVVVILSNLKAIGIGGMKLFNRIKASLFGIIPLIRSCIYLRYKKKADTIQSLEQQAAYIRQNVEILRNKKSIDPEAKEQIIRKQEAIAQAYNKKAEKLRAELCQGELDARDMAAKSTDDIRTDEYVRKSEGNTTDFVIEGTDASDEYEIIPADMPLPSRTPTDIGEMEV